MFPNARYREIPEFSGKKFGTQKMRPGTQTSNIEVENQSGIARLNFLVKRLIGVPSRVINVKSFLLDKFWNVFGVW